MNKSNEALEELVDGINKDNRRIIIVLSIFGVCCVGFSLVALVGILPSELYKEGATTAEKKEALFTFIVVGAIGLAVLAPVLWRFIRPRSSTPEDFWSDNL